MLVLDHNAEAGAKILISGGGRCNFTNLNAADPARYISANPHFARSALTRHKPADFIALVEKHGIAYYEKTLGQLFCEGARASGKIVRMLLDECFAVDVALQTDARVLDVRRSESFTVETSAGAFESETLVVAAGGLSIPKLGASGLAFDIAKQFGVAIVAARPGLVPLTFGEHDLAWMRPLSGLSTPITARCGRANFAEAALLTHRGLSGPAILQVSSYWTPGAAIDIDWLPTHGDDWLVSRKRARPKAQLRTLLAEALPDRLAGSIPLALAGEPSSPVHNPIAGDEKDAVLLNVTRGLKAFPITPAGTEGYAKAEVTVGGVDTNALSQQTMEARAVPGLFFVGEAVDVTGWLGGYNFQWAWSSGWAAGQAC